MYIVPLTSFNGSTIYFMSCHGSSILFTEVLYAGRMVLENVPDLCHVFA
jgi:hypothetical protein